MIDYQMTKQLVIENQTSEATIAFLHCYDLIEDFAYTLGLSLEAYCREFSCNYMFGYANALKQVGVRTVIFYISARVTEPVSFVNELTGTKIIVLPAPKIYRIFRSFRSYRRRMLKLEGEFSTNSQSSKNTRPSILTPLKNAVSSIGTYISTPLLSLRRELRRENCVAILCQSYEYGRLDTCVMLGKLMRLPVFAAFQGGDMQSRSFIESLIRPISLHNCKGLIIAAQDQRKSVFSKYKLVATKVAPIFNPLDVQIWQATNRNQARNALGISKEARVVVCHGRIEIYTKGLDILLEAWEQICRQHYNKDLQLLLLGTGSDSHELRQRIEAKQLQGIIWRDEFVNDRNIILQYLSAADVYTLSSRVEGFPIAPIEAMACSLPIVAASVPGVAEILEGGEESGGIIVPRENAAALAAALGRVIDDEAWGRELGKRARQRIEEHFSPEIVGKQLRDFLLYNKL